MKTTHYAAILLAGASAVAFTSVASAQTAAPAPASTAANEVVVTGSRVIKNGNNSPTPVTVVSVDDVLKVQPTTIADALNDLPVFSGQRDQFSNPGGGTAPNNGGGNSAANNLNLRNMGPQRTLILMDGNRVPSTSQSGLVDVDMIPQLLLQRVDVVTGGTSAVYGSDAVTGVVNFITDKNFNGLKLNIQTGGTQSGVDRSYDIGIAAGRELFGGKGHVEASYEYRDDEGVLTRDPLGSAATESVQGAGTAADPYYLVSNARISTSSFGGMIVSGALSGQNFSQNGVLSPFVNGTASGTTGIQLGGQGVYYDDSLKSPLRSNQVFGRFDYDFTDKIHGYVEVAGDDKNNYSFMSWIALNKATIGSQDAFLAPAYQGTLATAGQSAFQFSKSMMDTPRSRVSTDEQQVFINSGLNGDLGDSYKWNVGFVHGTAHLTETNYSDLNNGRLYASLDAVTSGGQTVCSVTITNPGLYPGCVPLNPFGPTSDNAAALAYIEQTTSYTGTTNMDDVNASFSGAPFSTWAGPVNIAVSAEWRRQSYVGDSNALPTSLLNCTGLRYNCTATSTLWSSTIATRSLVSEQVSEGALEFDAPILKDLPFAQSFDINGAARYTDYTTSGAYTTWKVGGDWHVNDQLVLRATASRDIRAPTLDDLYSPLTQTTGGTFSDLLTGQVATNVTSVTSGNPNIKAEIGNTQTFGFVYTPHWLPRFSLAVDAFNITVNNAILNLLAQNVTYDNTCIASGGSSPYCSLYVRPLPYSNTTAANNVTTVYNTVINIAEQHTQGVDFEMNYATSIMGRPLSIRGLTTYQPQILYIQPGITTLNQAGVAFGTNGVQAAPVWRVSGFLRFSPIDNLSIDWLTRYRTALALEPTPTLIVSGPQVGSATFTDATVSYDIKNAIGTTELFLNVTNLFNAAPPPAAYSGGQTIPGQQGGFVIGDDPIGRAFMVGIHFRH